MLDLLVAEVFQGDRDLVFSLLVEDNFEAASVVVDFKERAHGLLLLVCDAAHNDDLCEKQWLVDEPSENYIAQRFHLSLDINVIVKMKWAIEEKNFAIADWSVNEL